MMGITEKLSGSPRLENGAARWEAHTVCERGDYSARGLLRVWPVVSMSRMAARISVVSATTSLERPAARAICRGLDGAATMLQVSPRT